MQSDSVNAIFCLRNMPQDSFRSVVYRSFVTCDDPKGVVDCGTIRKSKMGSQKMKNKMENQVLEKNSEKHGVISKGFEDEFHGPSSSQLLEVSKGAQKLNETIDSWSKGLNLDGQSKDIAKDLLKGALDLQDSLIMLAKLQEASRYMSRLKNKQKKFEIGQEDEVSRNNPTEFLKPRFSTDGFSRDCIEELREVIRGSLAKQNLLPDTTTKGNTYFHQKNLDSGSEKPSTSSSHSSTFHSEKFDSADPSLPSTTGPNLIARLMGLDSVPSKPMPITYHKQLDSEKYNRRPFFDIDMPKVRKPQIAVQNANPERRSLKEVLDTMQFKGLLKGSSGKTIKPRSHNSDDPYFDITPIVLIKPLHVPRLDSEQEGEYMSARKMIRKTHLKEELPPKAIDHEEGILSSKKMYRKADVETPIKQLSRKGAKDFKEVVKSDEKEIKVKEKVSYRIKASSPSDKKPQKKEAIDKKPSRIQMMTSSSKKPAEKEKVKSKTLSRSQDQAKVTATKLRKPVNKSNIAKNQMPQQQSTSHSTSKRSQPAVPISSTWKKSQGKKDKPVKEHPSAEIVNETLRTNPTSENASVMIGRQAIPIDELPADEERDTHEVIIEECSDNQNAICDVMPLIPEHQKDNKTHEEAHDHIDQNRTNNNMKALLLGSPSFVSQADELFDLTAHSSIVFQINDINNFGEANEKLSLDCANELIKRRSLPDSQTLHPPLLTCPGNWRICASLEQLVEEVCDGLEILRKYSKLGDENFLNDSIYGMLKRDLRSNGVMSGVWDLGWKSYTSMDEIEQVVNYMEMLLLSKLIEELFL